MFWNEWKRIRPLTDFYGSFLISFKPGFSTLWRLTFVYHPIENGVDVYLCFRKSVNGGWHLVELVLRCHFLIEFISKGSAFTGIQVV